MKLLNKTKNINQSTSSRQLISYTQEIDVDDLFVFITNKSYKNKHQILFENNKSDLSFVALGCIEKLEIFNSTDLDKATSFINKKLNSITNISETSYANPKFFGGYAFDIDGKANNNWKEFPRGYFILPEIIIWAEKRGLILFITDKILAHKNSKSIDLPKIDSKDKMKELDFILVLGGDGTFLSCARAVQDSSIPIVGIHLGDLGFLAKVTIENMFQRLDEVASGDFTIDERSMAKATVNRNKSSYKRYGLNDFVISNGESHRMLNLDVYVDDIRVSDYKADGLIIATPTGSTAYSLSSGGPIIAPNVDSFVITPISAHTLNSRPLVVSAKSIIKINFSSYNNKIMFITDGQVHELLSPTDIVTIKNSEFKIGLIDFADDDYFQTLRTKMGWGKRGN